MVYLRPPLSFRHFPSFLLLAVYSLIHVSSLLFIQLNSLCLLLSLGRGGAMLLIVFNICLCLILLSSLSHHVTPLCLPHTHFNYIIFYIIKISLRTQNAVIFLFQRGTPWLWQRAKWDLNHWTFLNFNGNLFRVYLTTRPMSARIGSSPPCDL